MVVVLIRSVKKTSNNAIGQSIVTFNELQTVLFKCANLINERLVGVNNAKEQDFSYLCPNDVVRKKFISCTDRCCKTNSLIKRVLFLESLVDSFWRKWTHNYFPSILVQQKWHHTRRNIAIDDLIIISEKHLNRGQWKVANIIAGGGNVVRRMGAQYKNKDVVH